MEIKSEIINNILVIQLQGEITLSNANDVSDFIDKNIQEGKIKVILNMAGVDYLDSSAVGMIVASYSNLQSAGGDLRMCSLKPEVMEIFSAASLDSFLTIDKEQEESVISFQ